MLFVIDFPPERAQVDAAHLRFVRVLNLALRCVPCRMNISRKSLSHSHGRSVVCLGVLGVFGIRRKREGRSVGRDRAHPRHQPIGMLDNGA